METLPYAAAEEAVADLRLPPGDGAPPTVILIHGGFWRQPFRRELMSPLAEDLTGRGYATWNIEYRRLGDGGGWPETFLDVAAAVDQLAEVDAPLDHARVAVLGHSAGGQLALWVAARHRLTDGPGARPRLRPTVVVALAAVTDLVTATEEGLGSRAAQALLGGPPTQHPARYARVCPHGAPAAGDPTDPRAWLGRRPRTGPLLPRVRSASALGWRPG